ncbi:MAG: MBL fold metallo-hydrolase [Deltaproteobacteria bacterium]|nr:MBL fold metallo-hydrolase [Deltaproteobacteria bacterium]
MPRPHEDLLQVAGLRLIGIAEGGVETNLRVPELKLMFDMGMCPPGALSFERVLVSHGHADHLAGLHYYISQRGMMKLPPPVLYVPAEILDPLHRILSAWSEIEGFPLRYELVGCEPERVVKLGRGLSALPLRTHHRVPSLAWLIRRHTQRLDAEYEGRAPEELQRLREAGVRITHEVITPLLCVTGDTKISFFLEHEVVRQCKVLVHECTAWDDRRDAEATRKWGHTHVDEWVEHVEAFEGEALVLVHRSLRHSKRFAERVVRERFPVHMQGKVHVFGH